MHVPLHRPFLQRNAIHPKYSCVQHLVIIIGQRCLCATLPYAPILPRRAASFIKPYLLRHTFIYELLPKTWDGRGIPWGLVIFFFEAGK